MELLSDLSRDDLGGGQVDRVLDGVILEPDNVEVGFVACQEFVVGE